MLLNKVCQGFVQLPGRDGKGQGTAVRVGDPYLARVVGVYCHQFILRNQQDFDEAAGYIAENPARRLEREEFE